MAECGQPQGVADVGDLVLVGLHAIGEPGNPARVRPQAHRPAARWTAGVEDVDRVDVSIAVGVVLAEVVALAVEGVQSPAGQFARPLTIADIGILVVGFWLGRRHVGRRNPVVVGEHTTGNIEEVVAHRTVVPVSRVTLEVEIVVEITRGHGPGFVGEVDDQGQAQDVALVRRARKTLLAGQHRGLLGGELVAHAPGSGGTIGGGQTQALGQASRRCLIHDHAGGNETSSVGGQIGVADLIRSRVPDQGIAVEIFDPLVELVTPDKHGNLGAVGLLEYERIAVVRGGLDRGGRQHKQPNNDHGAGGSGGEEQHRLTSTGWVVTNFPSKRDILLLILQHFEVARKNNSGGIGRYVQMNASGFTGTTLYIMGPRNWLQGPNRSWGLPVSGARFKLASSHDLGHKL